MDEKKIQKRRTRKTIVCDDDIPGIKIGINRFQSETSKINVHKANNGFVFADTPGFHDTSGITQNIANSYGIMKALQQCRSVKIVLVAQFSEVQATRGS